MKTDVPLEEKRAAKRSDRTIKNGTNWTRA